MENSLDALPERVDLIERKLDGLSVSVDQRFDAVDKRFDAVDKRFDAMDKRFDAFEASVTEHFVEQRQYTEFAFGQLDARLSRVEGHVVDHTGRLDRIERKLDQLIDLQFRPIPRSRRSPKKS